MHSHRPTSKLLLRQLAKQVFCHVSHVTTVAPGMAAIVPLWNHPLTFSSSRNSDRIAEAMSRIASKVCSILSLNLCYSNLKDCKGLFLQLVRQSEFQVVLELVLEVITSSDPVLIG